MFVACYRSYHRATEALRWCLKLSIPWRCQIACRYFCPPILSGAADTFSGNAAQSNLVFFCLEYKNFCYCYQNKTNTIKQNRNNWKADSTLKKTRQTNVRGNSIKRVCPVPTNCLLLCVHMQVCVRVCASVAKRKKCKTDEIIKQFS